jgi:DNA repair exonuclease SbcCD nuclease subunit
LGYRQYNLNARYEDFIDAFLNAIELIIEKKPDFVLLAGDLFEHYNPKPGTIRKCIIILEKLQRAKIPIFVIRGNHDVSFSKLKRYGGDILDLLEDLSLIHYIKDDVVVVKKDNEEIAIIAGMGYYGKKSSVKLSQILKENDEILSRKDLPKILMLHAFVEDMISKGGEDLSSYNLNQLDFDYIAMGHYHLQWPKNYKDPKNKIFCSGATEHRNALEWKQKERGFFHIECENQGQEYKIKPEFCTYKVRPKKRIELKMENTTARSVMEELSEIVRKNDEPETLLKIFLKGSLRSGEISLLDLNSVKNLAQNLLHLDISTNLSDSSVIITEKLNLRDAITDVLQKRFRISKNDLPSFVSLIEGIMNNVQTKDFVNSSINLISTLESEIGLDLEKISKLEDISKSESVKKEPKITEKTEKVIETEISESKSTSENIEDEITESNEQEKEKEKEDIIKKEKKGLERFFK